MWILKLKYEELLLNDPLSKQTMEEKKYSCNDYIKKK